MTFPARITIVIVITLLLSFPGATNAAIGLQEGFESSDSSVSSVSSDSSSGTESTVWQKRRSRTQGFWEAMMNSRKTVSTFQKEHAGRLMQRAQKRIACHEDVRKANRDQAGPITMRCFRAVLTQELEILRKQKQFVEGMAGVREQYRSGALITIENLMKAIESAIASIDAGEYESKEDLQKVKQSLSANYRAFARLGMLRLRIDRSTMWIDHLLTRLNDILEREDPPAEVIAFIGKAIPCLEQKASLLESLLTQENYEDVIENFRQVQSELKICTELARSAAELR